MKFDGEKKYIGSCCGNSFVIFDCRNIELDKQDKIDLSSKDITEYKVDSALFINNTEDLDISIEIFEKDGSESEFCGNGIILIANFLGLNSRTVKMRAGAVYVEGNAEKQAILMDTKLSTLEKLGEKNCLFIKMGEPHVIYLTYDLNKFDLIKTGKDLQKNYPNGVNVNAIQKIDGLHYLIRTYERGVLAETKSCGTGSLSSYIAISHFDNKDYQEQIEFESVGGNHWVSKTGNMLRLETLKKYCRIKALY